MGFSSLGRSCIIGAWRAVILYRTVRRCTCTRACVYYTNEKKVVAMGLGLSACLTRHVPSRHLHVLMAWTRMGSQRTVSAVPITVAGEGWIAPAAGHHCSWRGMDSAGRRAAMLSAPSDFSMASAAADKRRVQRIETDTEFSWTSCQDTRFLTHGTEWACDGGIRYKHNNVR